MNIVISQHLAFDVYPRVALHSASIAVVACLSVCLSVTRRCCIETDKDIIKLFSHPFLIVSSPLWFSNSTFWLRNSDSGGPRIIFSLKTLNNGHAREQQPLIVIVAR